VGNLVQEVPRKLIRDDKLKTIKFNESTHRLKHKGSSRDPVALAPCSGIIERRGEEGGVGNFRVISFASA
jgi:hypothetical protein